MQGHTIMESKLPMQSSLMKICIIGKILQGMDLNKSSQNPDRISGISGKIM